MKFLSVILLSCAALTYAADEPQAAKIAPAPDAGSQKPVYKKLGAVTWDPDAHKLAWTVETGSLVNGEFVSSSQEHYEISPDEATMGTAGEKRGFDNDEAEDLHRLLDVLSLYCAESVEWWTQGAGTPLESKPTDGDTAKPDKPVKVQQPAAPSKPSTPPPAPLRIAPGQAVAELRPAH